MKSQSLDIYSYSAISISQRKKYLNGKGDVYMLVMTKKYNICHRIKLCLEELNS